MSAEPTPTWRELIAAAAHVLGDRGEARWIVEEVAREKGGLAPGGLGLGASPAGKARVVELVQRRRGGEPLQHLLRRWAFRTLEVTVDPRALVPRPETEVVVEVALQELDRLWRTTRPASAESLLPAVDLGTGSGVIALSIAAERSFAEVTAVDRSPEALELARENVHLQTLEVQARLHLLCGQWYAPLPARLESAVGVVVSNPPYVARSEWEELEDVVRLYDPYEALVAGETGLEAIEAVVAEAPRWLCPNGAVVVEIAPHQAERARAIAASARDRLGRPAYASVEVLPDLTGRPRVLLARP